MSAPIGGLGAITSVFGPVSPTSTAGNSDAGFGGVLKNAVEKVDGLQNDAASQVNTLISGGNADLGSVMISVEKADVAFQLMMQVRNKIVSAYQDIEKMQF